MGQVLLGHLPQEVILVDESVVNGDVESGECALEVGHHQEDRKRNGPFVVRHERQANTEGHVRFALVHLAAADHKGKGAS